MSKNQILKSAVLVLVVVGLANVLRKKNVPVASPVAKAVLS